MKDDGTRVEIIGKVLMGWKARLILLMVIPFFVGMGFYAGWQSGIRHVCAGGQHVG